MPGLPLPQPSNQNIGREYAYPGSTGQAFRQQLRTALSPDEKLAAERDLALYCKPVELYNIIQRRAVKNPLFIQRCLLYNIHARRKKRIQITISLSRSTNTELQAHYVFPLYVLLARPTSNLSLEGHSPIYRFSRARLLTSFSELGNKDNSEATFIIPDVKSLSTSRPCNLDIIFISCGQVGQSNGEDNCSGNHVEGSSLQMLEGKCSWGKIPTNLLASSLESCVNLSLGHIVELASKVTMRPSFLEPKFLEQDSCLTFCSHKVDAAGSYQLQLCMSAQEAGARDMSLSPYSSYLYNDVPPSSLSDIIREKMMLTLNLWTFLSLWWRVTSKYAGTAWIMDGPTMLHG
ncbi:polycomb group protein EMF2B-like isoform X3 [Miscanthus floridulus]|uniref:polycomb group protein EMF2B-like isoform X3 n=1 Tax=Miscanthus floridulus TaxID=154761 RepID=UPI00345B142A